MFCPLSSISSLSIHDRVTAYAMGKTNRHREGENVEERVEKGDTERPSFFSLLLPPHHFNAIGLETVACPWSSKMYATLYS